MPVLRGVVVAPAAARWLATTSTARVLNVFDRACNLLNQDEAVLALVAAGDSLKRGLTPFALVVDGPDPAPFRGLAAVSPVRLARPASVLQVGPLAVHYASASAWDAQPDWTVVRQLYTHSPEPLARLAGLAARVTLEGSLLDLYRTGAEEGLAWSALLATARPAAQTLVAGVAARDETLTVAGARALAGLGSGLTQAGDDFLVGVLLAAWAGLFGPGAERLGPALVAAAVPRTTTLSAAYLRAAGEGACMALWHTLFAAQARGDSAVVARAVDALVSIGHTSGADALAGFLAVHFVSGWGSAPPAPTTGG